MDQIRAVRWGPVPEGYTTTGPGCAPGMPAVRVCKNDARDGDQVDVTAAAVRMGSSVPSGARDPF